MNADSKRPKLLTVPRSSFLLHCSLLRAVVIINEMRQTKGNDSMKSLQRCVAIILAAVALLAAVDEGCVGVVAMVRADEHFSVREYNLFHDVLHPLQHEALPKKDFKTIRARAAELVTRGRVIVRLGVPAGVQEREAFEKELKQFEKALAKFKADARKRSDARLEQSYNAVHDSFELLASMLPRK